MPDRAGIIIHPFARFGLPPRTVLLTFDDGPNGAVTAHLLDVLHAAGVHAAFCVIGTRAAAQPELIRRLHAEGHLLVNHGMHHALWRTLFAATAAAEVDACNAVLARILGEPGYRARYYRPAGGLVTGGLLHVLRARGMRLLACSAFINDHLDGPATADRVTRNLLTRLQRDQGGVTVLHDGLQRLLRLGNPNRTWVPAAVQALITTLRADGYSFTTTLDG